jgi:hypothetical protein
MNAKFLSRAGRPEQNTKTGLVRSQLIEATRNICGGKRLK